MDQRFDYLLDRVGDATFTDEPFPHLYLTDFLSAEDFTDVVSAPEVALPPATDIDDLFAKVEGAGYERIDFPGCVSSKDDYVRWLEEDAVLRGTKPTCEAQGLAFRLAEHSHPKIAALDAFFHSPELHALLVDKFELARPVVMEGGVQKYLHGYEISPHPDIRKKALTWMLNVNPAEGAEDLPIHTHYMRLKPRYAYVAELWRNNPTAETCWVPWDWCETVSRQTENNSIVFFSPRWDTIHAVRTHYDHLAAQRTQFYGNLWYDPKPRTTVNPDHEDLSFTPRDLVATNRDLSSRLEDLEAERDELADRLEVTSRHATELGTRLDGIERHPAVRTARRAKALVGRLRGGR